MALPVSIVRCADYDPERVLAAVREALAPLGGMGEFVRPGQRVLLKPNLLYPRPPEMAVTTHPQVVRAAALLVREAGGEPWVGDSPPLHPLETLLAKTGIGEVMRELAIAAAPLKTPEEVPGPPGGRFRALELSAEALDFDVIVNLPKLKTHGQMTLTLGVKNLFGLVVGMAKPAWHLRAGDDPRFADLLLDIAATVRPALTILDGVVGMEGNGPGSGSPRTLGLLVASPEPLAMDFSVARLLGVPETMVPILVRARAREMLKEEPSFPLLSPEQVKVADFRLPPSATSLTWRIPDLPRRLLRRHLSSFPAIDPLLCTVCARCEEICPASALRTGSQGMLLDRSRCIGCFCCQETCPQKAIVPRPAAMLRFLKRIGWA